MKKKVFLAAALLAFMAAGAFAQQYNSESDFTVTRSGNAITITGFVGTGSTGINISIPPTIQNTPVTAIGTGAFQSKFNLQSVIIPNGVTTIGTTAFASNARLTSVTIPGTVTSIGIAAFNNCVSLASVTFLGTIPSSGFGAQTGLDSDLRAKYLAGGPGIYTKSGTTWTLTPAAATATTTAAAQQGSRWIQLAGHPFGGTTFNGVAFGNGKFVLVGGSRIGYSTDGIEWQLTQAPSGNYRSVAFGNGNFVAVGTQGRMAYSADGVTWTAVANSTFGTSNINSVIYSHSTRFIAVGDAGKAATSTDNGITWTAINPGFGTSNILNVVRSDGGLFVVVGQAGKMATSTNLTAWTTVNTSVFSNADILSIAFGGSRYVAVTERGVYNSSNGTAWTAVSNFPLRFDDDWGYTPKTVFFANGVFVIGMGGDLQGDTFRKPKIAYSTDGVTWRETGEAVLTNGNPSGGTLTINAFAYGNGRIVGVGNMGTIQYSE